MDEAAAKQLVLDLGVALHRFGTPAHRLEGALTGIASRLGIKAQFFSTPTQIMAGFGEAGHQQAAMVRVQPGDMDLEKLDALDAIVREVLAGQVEVADALTRVHEIVDRPKRYKGLILIVAFALSSAAMARFFDGSAWDLAAAAVVGTIIGVLSLVLTRTTEGSRVFELVAAFVAAAAAVGATRLGVPISFRITMLAGLVVLLPGLTLTVAMNELATRNLVSGTARLTSSAIVFLEIGFGVALGQQLMTRIVGEPLVAQSMTLPTWTEPVAIVVAALSLGTLFFAHPRSLGIIVLSCTTAFYGARVGAWLVGPMLGASVGAFLLGTASNAWSRSANRPAMVALVPGLVMLVPGSVGFRSVSSLLDRDVVAGVDTAFTMIIVAVSLVAGLLVANAAVPPARDL